MVRKAEVLLLLTLLLNLRLLASVLLWLFLLILFLALPQAAHIACSLPLSSTIIPVSFGKEQNRGHLVTTSLSSLQHYCKAISKANDEKAISKAKFLLVLRVLRSSSAFLHLPAPLC